jgi:hypothetical protein
VFLYKYLNFYVISNFYYPTLLIVAIIEGVAGLVGVDSLFIKIP